MRKILALGLTMMLLVTSLLVACSGTPKPPVSKQINLDKLVTENMTIEEVNALMTPALKATYTLYQASQVTQNVGAWAVNVPEGGFAPGVTADYQVMFFHPDKGRSEYYGIFFKNGLCLGTGWFGSSGGQLMEKVLKGQSVTTSTTPSN
jgi:hypothetical protein